MSIPAAQPSNNNEPSDQDQQHQQQQQHRVIPELRVHDNRSGEFGQTDFTRSNESLPYIDIKNDPTPRFLSPPAALRFVLFLNSNEQKSFGLVDKMFDYVFQFDNLRI